MTPMSRFLLMGSGEFEARSGEVEPTALTERLALRWSSRQPARRRGRRPGDGGRVCRSTITQDSGSRPMSPAKMCEDARRGFPDPSNTRREVRFPSVAAERPERRIGVGPAQIAWERQWLPWT